jgi:hypothetical protein
MRKNQTHVVTVMARAYLQVVPSTLAVAQFVKELEPYTFKTNQMNPIGMKTSHQRTGVTLKAGNS